MLTLGVSGSRGRVDGVPDSSRSETLTVDPDTDLAKLPVYFTLSPEARLRVGGQYLSPGAQVNLMNPATFTVVAANGSTQDYSVTVRKIDGYANLMLSFGITSPPATGAISDVYPPTIVVTLPKGTPLGSLVATFTASPLAAVSVSSAPQYPGVTAKDFSSPVTYTAQSYFGSQRDYLVTVQFQ